MPLYSPQNYSNNHFVVDLVVTHRHMQLLMTDLKWAMLYFEELKAKMFGNL